MELRQTDVEKIEEAINSDAAHCEADVLEKDMWLTYFLQGISTFRNDITKIVFCGGTSLSKVHCAMDRMSEDADFKIIADFGATPSKSALRKALKATKQFFADKIGEFGLPLAEPPLARDENRFFSFKLLYPATFPQVTSSLKRHIQIECIHVTPVDDCVQLPFYTIADRLLGNLEPRGVVHTLTLQETVAEKTVALLRRIGDERGGNDSRRPYVMRHVYDLAEIFLRKDIQADAHLLELLRTKIVADQEKFRNHFPKFIATPGTALLEQLDRLHSEAHFAEEYHARLHGLMYSGVLPPYHEALDKVDRKIRPLLEQIAAEE